MTCIEEGLHMWDEVRIFGDDGLIELRRPLTVPIGWAMTWLSDRGQRVEELAADSHPGDATRNFVRSRARPGARGVHVCRGRAERRRSSSSRSSRRGATVSGSTFSS